MPVPLQHDEAERATARKAYETLEPFHVIAYFNPHLGAATKAAGLDWAAGYVGARAAPLGPAPAAVVTSCFYNFSPAVVGPAWDKALAHGLDQVVQLRSQIVERTLTEALGERVDDPGLAAIAADLRAVAETRSFVGRPLAAAWSSVSWPDSPPLALWQAITVLREWRGDGHIGTLVQGGLDPTEASVFHEANHPNPQVRKRGMGRDAAMFTRGWDEQAWGAAADRLVSRGLLVRDEGSETLSPDGAQLFDLIEEVTDDTAVWVDVPDADELLARVRPFVKAVIDAGVLPGTTRRT